SQNTPSEVAAFPMVQKTTSSPSLLNFSLWDRLGLFLYSFDANPKPRILDICPPVVEISEKQFTCFVWSIQSPSSFNKGVAKWATICLPAEEGSASISGLAYNCEKKLKILLIPRAKAKVWSL